MILGVAKQGLAVLNLNATWSSSVSLDPGFDQGRDAVKLRRRLIVEARIVVVLFGAGDQLFQRDRTILGQNEGFGKADFLSYGTVRQRKPKQGQKHASHYGKPSLHVCRRRARPSPKLDLIQPSVFDRSEVGLKNKEAGKVFHTPISFEE